MRMYVSIFTMLFLSLNAFAQKGRIEGKVVDSKTNMPLPGSTITLNGSTNGAIADLDGRYNFSIEANEEAVLKISSSGYSPKEISGIIAKTGEVITLNVLLETNSKMEDEIVIMRTTRRQETTAALIAFQKNTNTVSQVISAESIKRSRIKIQGKY